MTSNRREFLLVMSAMGMSLALSRQGVAQQGQTFAVTNVRDYGATGNGVTDDTSAVQLAIDAGKSVYFPAGTYRLNGVNLRSDFTYYGDGDNSVILLFQKEYTPRQAANYQSNCAFNLIGAKNIEIRDLKFICPTSDKRNRPPTEYSNIAINIRSSNLCRIRNVTVEQFSGIAVFCEGTSDSKRCTNILIDKLTAKNWYDAYDGSFPQIWFYRYVHDSIVQNSFLEGGTFGIAFYDAYNGTKVNGLGKDIAGAGVYRCSAINNVVKKQSRYGILLYCTRSQGFPDELVNHRIEGNTISDILGSSAVADKGFGAGIYAVGVTGLTVVDNNVSNCNQLTNVASLAPGCIGIVNSFGDVLVEGNTCSDGKWSNLYLKNINSSNKNKSGRLIVRNNTLKDSIRENLFCANCQNAVVSNNRISSGPSARLTPVSMRLMRDLTFENNVVNFDSDANQDGLFVYQSSRVRIVNNVITTLNPLSINRLQEVDDSVIMGNTFNSSNPFEHESVRLQNNRRSTFSGNAINKRFGGRSTRSIEPG